MQLFDFEKTDTASTYRRRALMEHGAFCDICGYGLEVKMLDVHHMNGDRTDGRLENLQVLCVFCHAIITRKVRWHKWQGSID